MSSFEKLFTNSTNRISAVKNIILSHPNNNFASNQNYKYINKYTQSKSISNKCNSQQIHQTFQQLQQKYDQLSKIISEANKQKNMMSILFDKIFQIQQGKDEKMNKRFRRKKNQIQAKYQCSVLNCNKIYSSSTSLARHAKLKHSYSCSQPPQHNYLIPPSPNLIDSNQIQKRDETKSNVKSFTSNDGDGSDGSSCEFDEVEYDADSQNSNFNSQNIEPR